jgi:hypothetical protein
MSPGTDKEVLRSGMGNLLESWTHLRKDVILGLPFGPADATQFRVPQALDRVGIGVKK